MKAWVKVFGIGFAFATLMLCVPGGSLGRAPLPVDGPQIIWDPAKVQWDHTSEFGIYKVIEDVQKTLDVINGLDTSKELTDAAIKAITDLHGNNGTMTDKEGNVHPGRTKIQNHLKSLKASKAKNYKIRLELVYATEFTDIYKNGINGKKDKNQIIHNLIFIFSNSYELGNTLVDPPSTATCQHSRICDCTGF